MKKFGLMQFSMDENFPYDAIRCDATLETNDTRDDTKGLWLVVSARAFTLLCS